MRGGVRDQDQRLTKHNQLLAAQVARQYGLIAEGVAKVYPELVVRDAKGRILSVRYDERAPMLLNVVQQQAEQIRRLEAAVFAQRDQDTSERGTH
jgi:trimeric autotransporter adhesin